MDERLSSSTVRGNAITLALCVVAAIIWVVLAISDFQRHWLTAGIWLLLTALNAYRALSYQVALTQSNLVCSRLFAQTAYYSLIDFVAIHQTERLPDRPLRICFKDGQSFPFSPKLKEAGLSLYAITKADFIAYWTEEITDRAETLAQ